MDFEIVMDREEDGRWIAEVLNLPGVLAYGPTPEITREKAIALAEEVITEQISTT